MPIENAVLRFGIHKGKPLKDIPRRYLLSSHARKAAECTFDKKSELFAAFQDYRKKIREPVLAELEQLNGESTKTGELRDQFAMIALPVLMGFFKPNLNNNKWPEVVATFAYKVADSMLKVRNN